MDIFRDIIRFFTTKEFSFKSKLFGIIVVILAVFLIDDLLGFSFYYSNNQKIDHLTNIENLKNDCADNAELLIVLDDVEKKIINRKNVFENFFDLFKSDKIDLKQPEIVVRVDTVYIEIKDTIINTIEIIPTITEKQNEIRDNIATDKKSRSQLWHTISSSFLLILILLILPFIPFTQKKIDWNLILGVIILMIPIAGLIWLYQFLLGLIPVIFDKPWINYILNFVIHIFSLLLFGGLVASISQKKGNKK